MACGDVRMAMLLVMSLFCCQWLFVIKKKIIINKIKTLAKRLTMEIMVNVGRFWAEIYIRRLNKKFVDFVDKIKSTDAISLKFYVCSRLI